MTQDGRWRGDGVTVVRGATLDAAMRAPGGTGRATAFDFAGSGGQKTWIGTATVPPGFRTGPHHHGHHEVAIYVVKGRSRIRWGERLEFAADIGPGDLAYFPPYVPHEEANLDDAVPIVFLVVRSDSERIAIKLDTVPVEQPEMV